MKKFMTVLMLLCLAIGIAGCSNDDRPVLNIYSWADYYDPEVLAQFEKENNCKITYDVFSSNEELLAKMQAGGSQYDIIQPSDYMVTTMLQLNMLEKLDLTKLPNLKNIDKSLQKTAFDPEGSYSPVYTYGITGIIYNTKYVTEPPTKWDDLWKEDYKGQVIMLNDCREVFSVALKKNGVSNNSKDPDKVKKAFEDLKGLNKNVLAYDTENIKQKFIAEDGWIGTIWSGDAAFAHRENPDLSFVIPKEGTLIWADTIAIAKGCKNKELAEKFINYMYDPKVSAKNFDYISLPNPNAAAAPLMSEDYKKDEILQYGAAHSNLGEWLVDIGDSITMYDEFWTELKATK